MRMRRYLGAKVQVQVGISKLLLRLQLLRSHYCSRMEDFVLITALEGGECIEVDVEDDGTLTTSSIQSQFGRDAIGLRYKNPATGNWRGVKADGDHLFPPKGGWSSRTYLIQREKPSSGVGEEGEC